MGDGSSLSLRSPAQERALEAAEQKLQAFKSDLILPEIFSHAALWEEWMAGQQGKHKTNPALAGVTVFGITFSRLIWFTLSRPA